MMTTSESASASILESITLEWYQWPQLSDRQPTPAFYQPLIFLLSVIAFFFRNRRRVAICIFPLIFDLCLRSPGYTFGNPSAEYYNSSFFIAVPLWFLEFAILSPHEGPDAPTYVGNARCDGTVSGESSDVIRPARRKVLRVCSLMVP
ncbi:hypothetical protein B0T12DRAFT_50823 [Alternaria alternata]|jgi:hypothetical protein|nr:hypothetical protein B0T12DRAFT_50823 [Alternaria alternata]